MNISSFMKSNKIFLLFLWHMHQPFYKDPLSGKYVLPWVRLHGSKDYLDMVTILDEFPDIRQNINVVPSLIQQISAYVNGEADDRFLELTLKPANKLSTGDKIFMLENFFLANWDNLIKPFPRYHDLLKKRGIRVSHGDIDKSILFFSDADFTDLQVLFNLAWIDPQLRAKDHDLRALESRGANFTENDARLVIEKQIDIMKKIIPSYTDMHRKGKIELSVTPFFHPILPLLCDTDSARMGMPDVSLPSIRFRHPEDAEMQIRLAIKYFRETFGFVPEGMWPSEGAVSAETLKIIRDNGIKWIATDEAILAASLNVPVRDNKGNLVRPDILYTDYVYNDVSMFFRDHTLSDLIGFVYSSWDPEKAAHDFYNKLLMIHSSSSSGRPTVVPIILDGENAWEYYKNDGHDFLNTLYGLINNDERIECLTISEYLKNHAVKNRLEKLHSGSWISGNFSIWIGHEEDNIAWDYISRTRKDLASSRPENMNGTDEAWLHLYAAEGSDWFWWYGDDHVTDNAREFDELFRHNLMAVYKSLGKEVPDFLNIPVLKEDRGIKPLLPIRGFINPTIDGIVTSYFEWLEGTYINVKKSGGSMHKSESIISKIYYGFNADHLFIRADSKNKFSEIHDCNCITVHFVKPANYKIIGEKDSARLYRKEKDEWHATEITMPHAIADIFEVAIPFRHIGVEAGDEIAFYITTDMESRELERYPWRGNIILNAPSPDFDAMMWY
ncbi:glycosyl hydrolase family 57 [bacterium BMS3Abin07]|nr:glycosyl hydrolase family 57 [bacterium BMS3Abin07]